MLERLHGAKNMHFRKNSVQSCSYQNFFYHIYKRQSACAWKEHVQTDNKEMS